MKKQLLVIGILTLASFGYSQQLTCKLDFDDGTSAGSVRHVKAITKSLSPSGTFEAPRVGQTGILIASLCSVSSPHVAQSRRNFRIGITGNPVATDPTDDPSAWHLLKANTSVDGLQWFDMVGTTFASWRGTTAVTSNTASEVGNSLVLHVFGTQAISNCWLFVGSTLPNVGYPPPIPLGTNSSGAELKFGANFIGFYYGLSRVPQWAYDPSTDTWIVGGDNKVYVNGESPSQVPYDAWVYFGPRLTVTMTDPSQYASEKAYFQNTPQSLYAQLRVGGPFGPSVAEEPVLEAQPFLRTVRDGNHLSLAVDGGQYWMNYQILQSPSIKDPLWTPFDSQVVFRGQQVSVVPDFNIGPKQMYYKLHAVIVPDPVVPMD